MIIVPNNQFSEKSFFKRDIEALSIDMSYRRHRCYVCGSLIKNTHDYDTNIRHTTNEIFACSTICNLKIESDIELKEYILYKRKYLAEILFNKTDMIYCCASLCEVLKEIDSYKNSSPLKKISNLIQLKDMNERKRYLCGKLKYSIGKTKHIKKYASSKIGNQLIDCYFSNVDFEESKRFVLNHVKFLKDIEPLDF